MSTPSMWPLSARVMYLYHDRYDDALLNSHWSCAYGDDSVCRKIDSGCVNKWDDFCHKLNSVDEKTAIDGHHLDIATLVAVARHGARIYLDDRALAGIEESAKALHHSLREGHVIYGVNTGFGGSADTRTRQVEELQRTLIRELHTGIIVPKPEEPAEHNSASPCVGKKHKRVGGPCTKDQDYERRSHRRFHDNGTTHQEDSLTELTSALQSGLPPDDQPTTMPDAWVRASILVRVNSLSSGSSGVRPILITTMMDLLKHDILPKIPLRGSISASGDLSPLSYIAGTLLGKRTLTVSAGLKATGVRQCVTAEKALGDASITPIRLGPKEGLAIVNGTAVSTAVGALALHDAHGLAVLAQVLTAMSVEALCGTSESFDPFFARVRPHPGQHDAGHNIYRFLAGSQLIQDSDGTEEGLLRQDRYSIRTASQWIGPVLEDLSLAHQQVTTECNSVTDNPLIDGGRTLHGGNFQARSITSAMEKTRIGLESMGRMLFTQCSEIIDPKTNRGLPPNLDAEEPNSSWMMKSLDITIAALQSELGFLANPVGSHVQTAEMGNQSLNSLALISARYCQTSLDVLSQLAAAHLLCLCQALDLRAMHIRFLEKFEPIFQDTSSEILRPLLKEPGSLELLHAVLWTKLRKVLDDSTTMTSERRFAVAVTSLQPTVLQYVMSSTETIPTIELWSQRCCESMLEAYETNRRLYSANADATPFLGRAALRMYRFVRNTLAIPFLRAHIIRSPDPESELPGLADSDSHPDRKDAVTIGTFLTIIYRAIRNGSLYIPAMESLREAQEEEATPKPESTESSEAEKVVDSRVSKSKESVRRSLSIPGRAYPEVVPCPLVGSESEAQGLEEAGEQGTIL